MTKQEKNEVIEVLKGKFTQYNNFYVTDTESLTVAQVTKLRSHCFDKQVEMRVAKNTLIKKALESLDTVKYAGVYDSLHNVTALLFSENPKEPALILSGFRKESKGEKPELKAAFINGDIFVGDAQLKALTMIKSKNELIGEVIGLLQAPIQRVLGALQNKDIAKPDEAINPAEETKPIAEATAPVPTEAVVKPTAEAAPTVLAENPANVAPATTEPAVKPIAEVSIPAVAVEKPVVEAAAASDSVVKPADEVVAITPVAEPEKLVTEATAEEAKPATDDNAAPGAKGTAAE